MKNLFAMVALLVTTLSVQANPQIRVRVGYGASFGFAAGCAVQPAADCAPQPAFAAQEAYAQPAFGFSAVQQAYGFAAQQFYGQRAFVQRTYGLAVARTFGVGIRRGFGFNRVGFNRVGFNRVGFNRVGFNRVGFNRVGFGVGAGLAVNPLININVRGRRR